VLVGIAAPPEIRTKESRRKAPEQSWSRMITMPFEKRLVKMGLGLEDHWGAIVKMPCKLSG
jgi:hypothetical protein